MEGEDGEQLERRGKGEKGETRYSIAVKRAKEGEKSERGREDTEEKEKSRREKKKRCRVRKRCKGN